METLTVPKVPHAHSRSEENVLIRASLKHQQFVIRSLSSAVKIMSAHGRCLGTRAKPHISINEPSELYLKSFNESTSSCSGGFIEIIRFIDS